MNFIRGIGIQPPSRFGYCRSFSVANLNVIIEEKSGPCTLIGINRPDVKNEIDQTTIEELANSLQRFESDYSSQAAVIYGVGGNFSTGCQKDLVPDIEKLITICNKPLIAGITGFATGFGFELAMLCDMRVIESTALIGLNANPYILSNICYQRLVGAVGSSVGMDLALTGRNLTAKEALEIGLVNRVVNCGTGIGQGLSLAKCIAKYPIKNLITAKKAILSVHTSNTGKFNMQ